LIQELPEQQRQLEGIGDPGPWKEIRPLTGLGDKILLSVPGTDATWGHIETGLYVTSAVAATVATGGLAVEFIVGGAATEATLLSATAEATVTRATAAKVGEVLLLTPALAP
jgi:hypothetical protein